MTDNTWHDLPKPFFALAPMEAVTDIVFRRTIASSARPDLFFTEFVNASSFCSEKGRASTNARLAFIDDEQPIIAQIWGNKPDEFIKMSYGLAEIGYRAIDINMGCPDKAVVKNKCGSALIRNPELAGELIDATKSSGLPVSVKTRLGDSKLDNWREWISFLLSKNLVNLTVHLRTRKEMSKVDAHLELIPEIIKLRNNLAPKTLITINGDIADRQKGIELHQKYGADGIMIGRGIFTNPFAFETKKTEHSRQELINLLLLQLDLHDKYSAELEPRKFEPLKRFFKIYIREFNGASELREQLMHSRSTAEVRQILQAHNATA